MKLKCCAGKRCETAHFGQRLMRIGEKIAEITDPDPCCPISALQIACILNTSLSDKNLQGGLGMSLVKIGTFTVNSVKTRLPVLESFLTRKGLPDILSVSRKPNAATRNFQEFFENLGYYCLFVGHEIVQRLVVISKIEPDEASFGLGDGQGGSLEREESEQCRVVLVRFGELNILNTYIPRGKRDRQPDSRL